MDFMQGLDPSKLVFAETVLSFLISPFTSPPYNLAIFLFGIYAQENTESVQALQMFTGLLGASAVFDVVWMMRHEQNGFVKSFTIMLLLLKIPTFFAFGNSLRQRGLQWGGIGHPEIAGPTVWSMPGGFTSGDTGGYQVVDEARPIQPTRPSAPSSALPQVQSQGAPGGYQTV